MSGAGTRVCREQDRWVEEHMDDLLTLYETLQDTAAGMVLFDTINFPAFLKVVVCYSSTYPRVSRPPPPVFSDPVTGRLFHV